MTSALILGAIVIGAPSIALAAKPCATPAAAPTPLPTDLVAAANQPGAYPTFCSIPAVPKVRSAASFKGAVSALKLADAQLQRQTAPDTWSLTGTEDFIAAAKVEAAPPPPMTAPSEGDTEAFIKAMRARATPPPRSH